MPRRRGTIRATAAWVGVEVRTAADVDGYVRAGGRAGRTLNVLERRMAASLIRRAPGPSRIVADGRALFRALERRRPLLTARDHADDTEPAVMAAAIIAKVERDRLLALLEKECVSLCGFIPRGGYPGPETTAWIATSPSLLRFAAGVDQGDLGSQIPAGDPYRELWIDA